MPRKKKTDLVKPEPIETALPVEATGENEVSKGVKEDKRPEPSSGFYFGNGRRKTASARARLYLPNKDVTIKGTKLAKGDIYVNNLPIDTYFNNPYAKALYTELYRTTNTVGRFITTVIVEGSGKTGQLGATTLAIARALVVVDPKFQPILRKKGFLTRDPRAKERKKPGLMGARKEKQSPKR